MSRIAKPASKPPLRRSPRSVLLSLSYTTEAMLLGLALVCLAAVTWGTTGSVMALLAQEGAPSPLLVGWARMAGAAPCLLLATALARPAGSRAVRWPPRDMAKAAMLGIAMAAYQLCYFWAVPRTGVALTALLAICSAPIMITAGAALALHLRGAVASRGGRRHGARGPSGLGGHAAGVRGRRRSGDRSGPILRGVRGNRQGAAPPSRAASPRRRDLHARRAPPLPCPCRGAARGRTARRGLAPTPLSRRGAHGHRLRALRRGPASGHRHRRG